MKRTDKAFVPLVPVRANRIIWGQPQFDPPHRYRLAWTWHRVLLWTQPRPYPIGKLLPDREVPLRIGHLRVLGYIKM